MAKRTGLSKQGVEYKINSFMRHGVVRGVYPIIDSHKLGYFYCRTFLTLQNATEEKYTEVVNYLTRHPKVFWMFKVHGPYDFMFAIWAKSLTEFQQFTEEFEEQFGENIKRMSQSIATDVVHLSHRYLLQTRETKELHFKETQQESK